MSIASDILKAAIDRSHAAHEAQAERVAHVCTAFADMLKKPWKARVEAIGEAVVTVRQIVEGKEDPPA